MKLKAPAHLSAESKELWRAIVNGWALDEGGLLILRVALESFDRLNEARALVERDGAVIKDRFGNLKAHPALCTEKEARLGLLRAWRQLGLDVEPPGPIGRPPGR